jgi:hypothetical protein
MSEQAEGEKEKRNIIVYQLNDQKAEFEELELDEDVELYELLDPSFILLFLDPDNFKSWLWQGSEVSTRMKFISANLAPSIRDQHGMMKIATADDGNERMAFKILVGLEKAVDVVDVQTGPSFTDTKEDHELLNLVSQEKIILTLDKIGLPEGYKREMVMVQNTLYKVHTQDTEYMGAVVEETQLLPLVEKVPDGIVMLESYIPRFLFSFNDIILTDFLKKMTPEELTEFKEKEKLSLQQLEEEMEQN